MQEILHPACFAAGFGHHRLILPAGFHWATSLQCFQAVDATPSGDLEELMSSMGIFSTTIRSGLGGRCWTCLYCISISHVMSLALDTPHHMGILVTSCAGSSCQVSWKQRRACHLCRTSLDAFVSSRCGRISGADQEHLALLGGQAKGLLLGMLLVPEEPVGCKAVDPIWVGLQEWFT